MHCDGLNHCGFRTLPVSLACVTNTLDMQRCSWSEQGRNRKWVSEWSAKRSYMDGGVIWRKIGGLMSVLCCVFGSTLSCIHIHILFMLQERALHSISVWHWLYIIKFAAANESRQRSLWQIKSLTYCVSPAFSLHFTHSISLALSLSLRIPSAKWSNILAEVFASCSQKYCINFSNFDGKFVSCFALFTLQFVGFLCANFHLTLGSCRFYLRAHTFGAMAVDRVCVQFFYLTRNLLVNALEENLFSFCMFCVAKVAGFSRASFSRSVSRAIYLNWILLHAMYESR